MQKVEQNGYPQFLRKLIEQKIYEGFNSANIPKSFYTYIINSMDMDDMIQKMYVKMAEHLKKYRCEYIEECIVLRKDARAVLGRCYNVPKEWQCNVLSELQARGYIKFVDKQKMAIIG